MEPTVHETVTQPSPSSPGRDKLNNDGEANSSAATPALTTTTTPPSTLAAARTERNSVVPPYWRKHDRNGSRLSSYSASDNGHPTPIGLEDHTDEDSEQCKVLWAKSVTIDDYVVVSGTAPGLGAYVVWNCTVETLDVSNCFIISGFGLGLSRAALLLH
ncbi:hypothetical protein NX059_003774 [Plenodomus lindquistii]|nr:hypothetical protein NX059_003774 [Plenodomus lindquistii]